MLKQLCQVFQLACVIKCFDEKFIKFNNKPLDIKYKKHKNVIFYLFQNGSAFSSSFLVDSISFSGLKLASVLLHMLGEPQRLTNPSTMTIFI